MPAYRPKEYIWGSRIDRVSGWGILQVCTGFKIQSLLAGF